MLVGFGLDKQCRCGSAKSCGSEPPDLPQGLTTVAQMLADGTITARIGSTVGLDAAGQVLDELRHGGLRGKASSASRATGQCGTCGRYGCATDGRVSWT